MDALFAAIDAGQAPPGTAVFRYRRGIGCVHALFSALTLLGIALFLGALWVIREQLLRAELAVQILCGAMFLALLVGMYFSLRRLSRILRDIAGTATLMWIVTPTHLVHRRGDAATLYARAELRNLTMHTKTGNGLPVYQLTWTDAAGRFVAANRGREFGDMRTLLRCLQM